ncbi:protein odr-4 homolog [Fopius arisanus]|uniref:Protein odr-4 homolog n=1 Tax=Fopius arisanus TaxID=64838 RepID=A0A9R1T6M5_9HYME|nr:PREDICTED: protein odr-4 homolog [Fopius arisanus]
MGRSVYAGQSLLNYLISLSDSDTYTVGLILGQSTDQRDYVIHLARTPPPAPKDVIEETLIGSTTNIQQESPVKLTKSVKDVPSSWVADHALHVTRMLPGGMWVLGIFVVGPSDCFSDSSDTQQLKSIISSLHKNFESSPYLYGNNPRESLILTFNSLTKKFSCKSFDVKLNNSMKNADWKFQDNITKWYQLETRVDLDQVFPVVDGEESETLKQQLQNILNDMSDIINSSLVIIEGDKRPSDQLIEIVGNKKKKERKELKSNESDESISDKSLQATIYVPCPMKSERELREVNCVASIRLVGQIGSRTFVHQKSTIMEATGIIKQDIMRSLASRLEMHWDSLLEEENELPEDNFTLHEPPRRVLVALPQSRITLSDYLFPGEGPQEALISLQELLDLQVQESSVQEELELQVDPSEFYCQNEINTEPTEHGKLVNNNQFMVYVSGLAAAILFLIAAVIIHYIY